MQEQKSWNKRKSDALRERRHTWCCSSRRVVVCVSARWGRKECVRALGALHCTMSIRSCTLNSNKLFCSRSSWFSFRNNLLSWLSLVERSGTYDPCLSSLRRWDTAVGDTCTHLLSILRLGISTRFLQGSAQSANLVPVICWLHWTWEWQSSACPMRSCSMERLPLCMCENAGVAVERDVEQDGNRLCTKLALLSFAHAFRTSASPHLSPKMVCVWNAGQCVSTVSCFRWFGAPNSQLLSLCASCT